MDLPNTFKDIAPFLQHPLVLVGFVILLFFGIVTALLKAGILPQLPQQSAADLAKRVINLGFIIAVLIIALGFWQYASHSEKSERHDSEPSQAVAKPETAVGSHPQIKMPPKHGPWCRVTLLIPSELNDAEILVDGKLADIVERKLTSVVIRMERREVSQKITLRNNLRECSTRVLVDHDKEVQACM
jgi:hypothetical protein